ncbi:hypothetical protein AB0436_27665 [Streptomyces sp. NPDC051322]|uniref:hypothetical protein n=1 Tax=Streptomyces sp. NPDC051322 TaxID=3154645 RepID=UPI003450A494
MGIESDQLVYDYLSRVGDLAQRQLSSGDRMRLVSSLRSEIDRQRARPDGEDTAAVLRILGRLGTPADQVAAAVGGGPPGTRSAGPDTGAVTGDAPERGVRGRAVRDRAARERGVRDRTRRVPRPRRNEKAEPLPRSTAALPPHLAGEDELGPSGSEPDWWRVDADPFGPGDAVPGFTGGVEIPEILRPPARQQARPRDDDDDDFDDFDGESVDDESGYDTSVDEEPVRESGPRRRLRLRRRVPVVVEPAVAARGFSSPFLLLAAIALIVGAVLGNLLVLAVGWLLAYSSRRLSRLEAKGAVLGLPALAVAGGLVWLWGRANGRWGSPIPAHGMGEAISGEWPVVLRVAAGASALYLIWRARRPVG